MFSKKQGQRLIPEYLLNYTEKLNQNHPDPSASWGGGSGGSDATITIVDSNNVEIGSFALNEENDKTIELPDYALYSNISGNAITLTTYDGAIIGTWEITDNDTTTIALPNYSTFSGDYNDLTNKPTIPTNTSDLNNDSGYITGINSTDVINALGYTPGTSNFSGSYNDLTDKPTIPTVNDATITLTQGGVTKGSFTLNQSGNQTIDLDSGGSSVQYVDYTDDVLTLTDGTNNFEVSEPLVVEQKKSSQTGYYKTTITLTPTGTGYLVDKNHTQLTNLKFDIYSNNDSISMPTAYNSLWTFMGNVATKINSRYYLSSLMDDAEIEWYYDGNYYPLRSIQLQSSTVLNAYVTNSSGASTIINTLGLSGWTISGNGWTGVADNNAKVINIGVYYTTSATSLSNTIILTVRDNEIISYYKNGSWVDNLTISSVNYTSGAIELSNGDTYELVPYGQTQNVSTTTVLAPVPNEYKITCDLPTKSLVFTYTDNTTETIEFVVKE